jgi:hypothetical protein
MSVPLKKLKSMPMVSLQLNEIPKPPFNNPRTQRYAEVFD